MTSDADREADQPLTRLVDGRLVTTEELTPLVYEDLRRLADSFFRTENPGITLQPTALVSEAWLRLAGQRSQDWQGRAHFLSMAATVMRRVLVEHARERGRAKRGGDWQRVTLSGADGDTSFDVGLIDLEDALQKLAAVNERYVRIIELRYFAGLTLPETAEVLGVTRTVIVREWAKARAWLATHLEEPT